LLRASREYRDVPAQLWGCYSVADHKSDKAFVADVVLYERVVVPVPAAPDGSDWDVEWEAAKQARLLKIMGEIALRIPWTPVRRAQWQQEWSAAQARDELLGPMHLTRMLISDEIAGRARGRADVRALPVYADAVAFDREWRFRFALPFARRVSLARSIAADDHPEVPQGGVPIEHDKLAKLLVTRLVLPAQGRTHEEMLDRAVAFAGNGRVAAWRAGFHEWLTEIASHGVSEARIEREAAQQVAAWNRRVKRKFTATTVRQSGTVVGGGLGISAAVWGGPLGPAAKVPVASATKVIADRIYSDDPGERLPAGDLLAAAQRQLRPRRRLRPA
jgi:hypothetical protein